MTEAEIATQVNTICALTDLLMGIIILPLLLILWRRKTDLPRLKKQWLIFFLALGAACFLGFVVHFCLTDPLIIQLVWLVLYPLLMEVVVLFDLTALCARSAEARPTGRDVLVLHLLGAAGVALSLLICLLFPAVSPFSTLSGFGVLLSLYGFGTYGKLALRPGHIGERFMLGGFVPILFGAAFEIRFDTLVHLIWYFDHDSILHLSCTLGIVIIFLGVLQMLKKK